MTSTTTALPTIVGLSGTVGSDRRFSLAFHLDPAYQEYEIHESTDDPAKTLKDTVTTSPRVSKPMKVRDTPLRYGVRGKTASGEPGPFGDTVEVTIRESGGDVSVTGEPFTLPKDDQRKGGDDHQPGDPKFPGDLIPTCWKLTTTLSGKIGNTRCVPLEVYRDGRSRLDSGTATDLNTYVDDDHWRLTHEKDRWGVKITCPSTGPTTETSHNTRWELRGMDAVGAKEVNFDLTAHGPALDTELCVVELQGNAGVVAQIHGKYMDPHETDKEKKKREGDDDLTVWRAEPNSDGKTYTLWITKQNKAHGGVKVDPAVPYNQAIQIGFRIGQRLVRYVYNGHLLDYKMSVDDSTGINFSKVKFYYKAGLYLQIADKDKTTSGTMILYSAQISGG